MELPTTNALSYAPGNQPPGCTLRYNSILFRLYILFLDGEGMLSEYFCHRPALPCRIYNVHQYNLSALRVNSFPFRYTLGVPILEYTVMEVSFFSRTAFRRCVR